MDASLRRMLIHTISVRKLDVTAGYAASDGAPTYAAAVTYPAYVENREKRGSHPGGSFSNDTEVVVITEALITKDDLVFLHGVDATVVNNGGQPKNVAILYEPEKPGPVVSHYEVSV